MTYLILLAMLTLMAAGAGVIPGRRPGQQPQHGQLQGRRVEEQPQVLKKKQEPSSKKGVEPQLLRKSKSLTLEGPLPKEGFAPLREENLSRLPLIRRPPSITVPASPSISSIDSFSVSSSEAGSPLSSEEGAIVFDPMTIPIKSDEEGEEAWAEELLQPAIPAEKSVAIKPFPLLIESDEDIIKIASWASYCTYTTLVGTAECRAKLEERYEYHPVLLTTWETGIPSGLYTDYEVEANVALVLIERSAPATRKHRRIYVAFTGTEGFADYLTDGSFSTVEARLLRSKEGTPFAKMHSHHGFHVRKELVYPHLRRILARIPLDDLRAMEVILCGHSMGSAIAVLFAMDCYHDFGFDALGGRLNALNQFKIVTMGSIQVMERSTNFFLGHLNHIRIHNDNDAMGKLMLAGSKLLGATAQVLRQTGQLTHGVGHWTTKVRQFTGIKATVFSGDMHRIGKFCLLQQRLQGASPTLSEVEDADWRAAIPFIPEKSRIDFMTDHSMLAYHVLAVEAFKHVKDVYAASRPDPIEAVRRLSMSIADRLRIRTCSRVLTKGCVKCEVFGKQEAHCWALDKESKKIAIGQYDMIDNSGMLDWTKPVSSPPAEVGFEACFHTLVLEGTPGTTINAGKIGDRLGTKTYLIDFVLKEKSPILPRLAQEYPDLFGALFVTSKMHVPFHCARVMQAPKEALEAPSPVLISKINDNGLKIIEAAKTFPQDVMKYIRRIFGRRAFKGHDLRFLDCTIEANRPWCPAVCRDALAEGSLLLNSALKGMCSMVAPLSEFPIGYEQRPLFVAVASQLPPIEELQGKDYVAVHTGRLSRSLKNPFGKPYGIVFLHDKKALLVDPSEPVRLEKAVEKAMDVRKAAKKFKKRLHRK